MISAIRKFYGATTVKQEVIQNQSRELSVSLEKFADRLNNLNTGALIITSMTPKSYKLRDRNGAIDITCEKAPNRNIGSLSVPLLNVTIDFKRYKAKEIYSFMHSFDHAFLKVMG